MSHTRRMMLIIFIFICFALCVWFFGPLVAINDARPLETIASRLLMIIIGFIPVIIKVSQQLGLTVFSVRQFAISFFTLSAAVLLVLVWSTSFTRNQVLIDRMEDKIADYKKLPDIQATDVEIEKILIRLNKLYSMVTMFSQFEGQVPILMGMGLYQGEKLIAAATTAYQRELKKLFLVHITSRLEDQINSNVGGADFRFKGLKIYLMLGAPARLDAEMMKTWMDLSWSADYGGNKAMQAQLRTHLDQLLYSGFKPVILDEQVVRIARDKLAKIPLAKLVYSGFKHDNLFKNDNPSSDMIIRDVTIRDVVGPNGSGVFRRATGRVPVRFTKGYFTQVYSRNRSRFIEQVRYDSWVLRNDSEGISKNEFEKLYKDVHQLYVNDYIKYWKKLLWKLRIVTFKNVTHATEVLNELSGSDSPLRRMLQVVKQNTSFSVQSDTAGKLVKKAHKVALKQSGQGNIYSSKIADLKKLSEIESPGKPIHDYFNSLNQLAHSKGDGEISLDRLLIMLSELKDHFQSTKDNPNMESNILRRLQTEAKRYPSPLNNLMYQVVRESKLLKTGDLRTRLNKKWQTDVYTQCNAIITNHYPFNRKSTQDIALQDFENFFRPGGVIDDFFNKNLKYYIDTTGRFRWKLKNETDASPGFLRRSLSQFQRAAKIRDTFFQSDGKLRISFSLKPVYLSPLVSRLDLDINGQKVSYRHGPRRVNNVYWPSPGQDGLARITFTQQSGETNSQTEEGPWAWFRLLDRAKILLNRKRRGFDSTFESGKAKATYQISVNKISHPNIKRMLSNFRCSKKL